MSKRVYFFAGANSYLGFYSYFDNIINPKYAKRIYIIKGGPGTGKSTFMKKISEYFLQKGYDIEFFPCASDIFSIDAIHVRKFGLAFIDGTSPHIVDPVYPGAVEEIINLGDYFDEDRLIKNREEIINLSEKIKSDFMCAYTYLKSAYTLKEISKVTEKMWISEGYLNKIAENICNSIFKSAKVTYKKGNERKLFLSAITPQGFQSFIKEYSDNFYNLFVINSESSFSSLLLNRIKDYALERGFDVEEFFCGFDPLKLEHLAIPELSTLIATSNNYHAVVDSRFLNVNIEFNKVNDKYKKFISEINSEIHGKLQKAINFLMDAKSNHDQLEKYYISSVDFKGVDERLQYVLKKIEKLFLL